MNLVFRTIIAFCAAIGSGCAGLKHQVQNDPIVKRASGNKYHLSVLGPEGTDASSSFFGRIVIDESTKWLQARGFESVKSLRQAHSGISFQALNKAKVVYVPGRTETIPVFGNALASPQESTTTYTGSNGNVLGTATTTQQVNPLQPTGYVSQYREGYHANVADRGIAISVGRFERFKRPIEVTRGITWPAQYSDSFFEEEWKVREAVRILLMASVLGRGKSAPPATSVGEPGCYPRLGMTWKKPDPSTTTNKFIIDSFAKVSHAQKAGLKIGDEVIEMDGRAVLSEFEWNEASIVKVKATRNGKTFEANVPVAMLCIDD